MRRGPDWRRDLIVAVVTGGVLAGLVVAYANAVEVLGWAVVTWFR